MLRRALESAGVEFIDDNGGGPGVRLKKKRQRNSKLLAAVRLDIAASAHLRDVMLGELYAIGSEDAATKWAHRRLVEKNKLNATDANHIEEPFGAKVKSFAIHHAEGVLDSQSDAADAATTDRSARKARAGTPSTPVDKSGLLHPEPRRIRDREHVRFVAQQTCLVCGRQPCDAHHLRFAQSPALGRKVSDEFTVPLCRVIIARCIVTAMKRRGGVESALIRSASRERSGYKHMCSAQANHPGQRRILARTSPREINDLMACRMASMDVIWLAIGLFF